jgi:hypothetical protein
MYFYYIAVISPYVVVLSPKLFGFSLSGALKSAFLRINKRERAPFRTN